VLEKIAATPGRPGKVALVTSGEPDVGKSSVARSLNAAAIDRGMLSVLVHIVPDSVAAPQGRLASEQNGSHQRRILNTTARSLNLLLGDGRDAKTSPAAGEVRSEFDLIIIDAPALGQQDDIAAIAAHSDFTILVVADGAADTPVVRRAKAALSRLGVARLGLVVNKIDAWQANPADSTGGDRYPAKTASLA
jgi:Mrp family chromosome partitioning ATPase